MTAILAKYSRFLSTGKSYTGDSDTLVVKCSFVRLRLFDCCSYASSALQWFTLKRGIYNLPSTLGKWYWLGALITFSFQQTVKQLVYCPGDIGFQKSGALQAGRKLFSWVSPRDVISFWSLEEDGGSSGLGLSTPPPTRNCGSSDSCRLQRLLRTPGASSQVPPACQSTGVPVLLLEGLPVKRIATDCTPEQPMKIVLHLSPGA